MYRPLLLLRRGLACPIFKLIFFQPGWRVPTRAAVYQGSLEDTVLFRLIVMPYRETGIFLSFWMRHAVHSGASIAILQSPSQCWSLQITDESRVARVLCYCASSTWLEGVGMSFTYRLNSTGRHVLPGLHQPACHEVWIWLTGRTFGMRLWFSPGSCWLFKKCGPAAASC
jgi:hypothetical protein